MANVGRNPRRTLPLIAVGLLLVAALGAAVVAVQSRAAPGAAPAEISEEELLSRVTSAPDNAPDFALTASIEQTVLPEGLVGASEGNRRGGDSGPRAVKLWRGGPEKVRTELRGENGDKVLIRNGSEVSAYDGESNTLKTGPLPQGEEEPTRVEGASPEEIDELLAEISPTSDLATGEPVAIAGRWAYPLTLEPKDKNSTLVERAEALIDAEAFVPLSFELHAEDTPEPVVSYEATDFEVGAVPEERFELELPPGATVEELEPRTGEREDREEPRKVASVEEAQGLVGFPVRQLSGAVGGRQLEEVLVAGEGVALSYGSGWGTVTLAERPEGSDEKPEAEEANSEESGDGEDGRDAAQVPTVDLGGGVEAKEITTPIGTYLSWNANGVEYSLSGSAAADELEEAARDLVARDG